jgi:hypothetical protein
MAQHEITAPLELLDGDGHITEEGWARSPYWRYDRSKIKAPWWRVKEWDYYYVLSQNREIGIALTMSDLGYAGLYSISFFDFSSRIYGQTDSMSVMPRGKAGFSADSDTSALDYADAKLSMRFFSDGKTRRLEAKCPGFELHVDGELLKGMECSLELKQKPDMDSMCIATSWAENKRAFYYNRKIDCMPASGSVVIGGRSFEFSPQDSWGGLDWGRGRWTYANRWYWGSASGMLDGVPLGWNIGYGFSDRTPASENVVFYANHAHKLSEVTFHINPNDYMAPWKFTSDDGRFEMDFAPILDRHSETKLLVISSLQHQVFGYYSGRIILDNGETLTIDHFLGFAEDVVNRW